MSSSKAPVAMFVYARPDHTAATLAALAANDGAKETDLHIFADAPRHDGVKPAVAAVRALISQVAGFRSVALHLADLNLGCSASIKRGIGQLLEQYGRMISIEDDIVTRPAFLRFINEGLERYQHRADIFAICGYNYPADVVALPRDYPHDIYLCRRPSPWGWGTWADRWRQVDWSLADYEQFWKNPALRDRFREGGHDMPGQLRFAHEGRVDAWDIQFSYAKLKSDAFTVVPVKTLVDNIGFDGSGEHSQTSARYRPRDTDYLQSWRWPEQLEPDVRIFSSYRDAFKPSLKRRARAVVRDIVQGNWHAVARQ
jgi:hypothetical protein